MNDKELIKQMDKRLKDPNAEYIDNEDFFDSLGIVKEVNVARNENKPPEHLSNEVQKVLKDIDSEKEKK